MIITAPQVQHSFAQHGLALHRYAASPELCDRHMCSGIDTWGGRVVYLAAAPRTDFVVVVLRTPAEAARIQKIATMAAERRANTLLLYLRSASARLAIVRRIFRS